MYAKYQIASGTNDATKRANVLNDLILILTGTTDTNSLSAACDKPNSSISAGSVVAGWTTHDTDAGQESGQVTQQVIKAAYSDDASNYKYARLYINSSSQLLLYGYETWTAGSNTGTNALGTGVYFNLNTLTAGGIIYLMSSARFLAIQVKTNNIVGNGMARLGLLGVFERTRLLPWDTVGLAYPKFILMEATNALYTTSGTYGCRIKNNVNNDQTVVTLDLNTIGIRNGDFISSTYFPAGASAVVYDDAAAAQVPLFPMYISKYGSNVLSAPLGEISSICDVWLAPPNSYTHEQTLTKGGNNYIAVQAYSYSSVLVPFIFRNG
jgi:hypothetical protein